MYSGRQPAMTPFTAMLQIVAARLSGSSDAEDSRRDRGRCSAGTLRSRSRVGGTIGRPSRQLVLEEVAVDLARSRP